MSDSLQVVSVNACRSLGSVSALKSLVSGISESYPSWGVVAIQECDGMHVSESELLDSCTSCMEPHIMYRHYGGVGNTSLAFIVNSKFKHVVKKLKTTSRCMSMLIRHKNARPIQLVNVHGQEDPDETMQEVHEHVHAMRVNTDRRIIVGDFNIDLSATYPSFPFRGRIETEELSLIHI